VSATRPHAFAAATELEFDVPSRRIGVVGRPEVPVCGLAHDPPPEVRLQRVVVRADPPRVAELCFLCPQLLSASRCF